MRQSKLLKVSLENINTPYYQVTEVFESVLNIQQHAGRKDDRTTRRKHGMQIEKRNNKRKNFEI